MDRVFEPPACFVCGKPLTKETALPDVSGWVCAACAKGQPKYAAAYCYCVDCNFQFAKGWEHPMNAKKLVLPHKFTCPKCKKRVATPVCLISYYAGLVVEGKEND